ncbi:hypothetical protein COOONC_28303 [Cooperia oncophora]
MAKTPFVQKTLKCRALLSKSDRSFQQNQEYQMYLRRLQHPAPCFTRALTASRCREFLAQNLNLRHIPQAVVVPCWIPPKTSIRLCWTL